MEFSFLICAGLMLSAYPQIHVPLALILDGRQRVDFCPSVSWRLDWYFLKIKRRIRCTIEIFISLKISWGFSVFRYLPWMCKPGRNSTVPVPVLGRPWRFISRCNSNIRLKSVDVSMDNLSLPLCSSPLTSRVYLSPWLQYQNDGFFYFYVDT